MFNPYWKSPNRYARDVDASVVEVGADYMSAVVFAGSEAAYQLYVVLSEMIRVDFGPHEIAMMKGADDEYEIEAEDDFISHAKLHPINFDRLLLTKTNGNAQDLLQFWQGARRNHMTAIQHTCTRDPRITDNELLQLALTEHDQMVLHAKQIIRPHFQRLCEIDCEKRLADRRAAAAGAAADSVRQ